MGLILGVQNDKWKHISFRWAHQAMQIQPPDTIWDTALLLQLPCQLFGWHSLWALLMNPLLRSKGITCVCVYTCAHNHTPGKPVHPTQDCRCCSELTYINVSCCSEAEVSHVQCFTHRGLRKTAINLDKGAITWWDEWMDINIFPCLYLTRLMIRSFSTKHFSVPNA